MSALRGPRARQRAVQVAFKVTTDLAGLQRPDVLTKATESKFTHPSCLQHCVCGIRWLLRALSCALSRYNPRTTVLSGMTTVIGLQRDFVTMIGRHTQYLICKST